MKEPNKQMIKNFAQKNKVYIRTIITESGDMEILMKDQKIGECRYLMEKDSPFISNDLYLMMVFNEMLSKLRVPHRESLIDLKS